MTVPPAAENPSPAAFSHPPQGYYLLNAGENQAGIQAYVLEEQHERVMHLLSLVGRPTALKAILQRLRRTPHLSNFIFYQSEDSESAADFGVKSFTAASQIWRSQFSRLPDSNLAHLLYYNTLALPEPIAEPVLSNRRRYHVRHITQDQFILLNQPGQDPAPRYHYFLNQRVEAPLHPYWAAWLWRRSRAAGETIELDSYGVEAWRCQVNEHDLRADLTQAVRTGLLSIPPEE